MTRPTLTVVTPAATPSGDAPSDDALMALAGANDARAFGGVQDTFVVAWENLDLVVPEGELVMDEAIEVDGRPSRRTLTLADSAEIGPMPPRLARPRDRRAR